MHHHSPNHNHIHLKKNNNIHKSSHRTNHSLFRIVAKSRNRRNPLVGKLCSDLCAQDAHPAGVPVLPRKKKILEERDKKNDTRSQMRRNENFFSVGKREMVVGMKVFGKVRYIWLVLFAASNFSVRLALKFRVIDL